MRLYRRAIHRAAGRDCPKSLGGACNIAVRATETVLFGPVWPPYTGQIHARSVARTLFGQFQKPCSRKPLFHPLGCLCVRTGAKRVLHWRTASVPFAPFVQLGPGPHSLAISVKLPDPSPQVRGVGGQIEERGGLRDGLEPGVVGRIQVEDEKLLYVALKLVQVGLYSLGAFSAMHAPVAVVA